MNETWYDVLVEFSDWGATSGCGEAISARSGNTANSLIESVSDGIEEQRRPLVLIGHRIREGLDQSLILTLT